MNERSHEYLGEAGEKRSRLSADVYRANWEDGAPGGFALAAAATARRRHWRRRGLLLAVQASVAALAVCVATWFWRAEPAAPARRVMVAYAAGERSEASRIEERTRVPAALDPRREHAFLLSDDEALELFRGRPLMVFTEPDGGRRIVLLDGE